MDIFLYTDNPSPSLVLKDVKNFLQSFGLNTSIRGDFITYLSPDKKSLEFYQDTLDSIRIANIEKPLMDITPSVAEEEYFKAGADVKRFLYDGNWLQRVMYKLLYNGLSGVVGKDDIHIVFTDKLLGTFGTKRYHARVVLAGQPSIISSSGLVEAPARPRQYYFVKAGFIQSGRDLKELDDMFENSFVKYNDERTTPILCSYTLQAVLYGATGREFCDNGDCCIYNSHWQSDVLRAQLSRKLCEKCSRLLKDII